MGLLLANEAQAEIGVPAAPGGYYVSVQGGYQNNDSPGISSGGASTVTPGTPVGGASCASQNTNLATPPGGTTCTSIAGTATARAVSDGGGFANAPDGWFGTVAFGYVLRTPMFGFISRVEVVGDFARNTNTQNASGAFGMRSVDNTAAIAFASVPLSTLSASTKYTEGSNEVTLRFKSDRRTADGGLYTLSVEPFYRYGTISGSTVAIANGGGAGQVGRTSAVDSDMFGVMLALEGLKPLSGNWSLIGRGAVGAYYLNANGSFSDFINVFGPLTHAVNNSASFGGARLSGEAGLKYQITPTAAVTAFGGVDWFSDVPVAVLPRLQSDGRAHIESTDLVSYKAGVRMTFALAPPPR